MNEFDITIKNIRLRVCCDSQKKELIEELMRGHAYIEAPIGIPTYRLVLDDNFVPKKYQFYTKMIDKWYDNATCDVWIDNNSKTVYMSNIEASNQKWKNLLIQYFTCNLFNRLLEEIGYIAFHSSCVEKDNKGIAFIAPRNSGKTNCMLNMMYAGYNSVTNDKLAIQFDGNQLNGYGVAQDVSIRLTKSFREQPQNQKYIPFLNEQNVKLEDNNSLESNKIHLESVQLAHLNGVEQVPTTNINSILYPSYDPNITEAIFKKLSYEEIDELLKSQRLPLVHDTTNFFKEVKTKNKAIYDEITTLKKIKELVFYKVIQSENTTNDFIVKTKKLLKTGNI